MVPLEQRLGFMERVKADPEMRDIYAFLFGDQQIGSLPSTFSHDKLLKALANGDSNEFQKEIAPFELRRTSEGSGWYENDCLIFLLLIGCERFKINATFFDKIFSARDRNANAVPRRVTNVYRALHRREYGFEGEFSFIKIAFLSLIGELRLTSDNALKVFAELTRPELYNGLSPFLKLLAFRAYDLILFQRHPKPFEDFDELVLGIDKLRANLKLGQACRLLWSLPYMWLLALILLIFSITPYFFGLGQRKPLTLTGVQHPDHIEIGKVYSSDKHPSVGVRISAAHAYRTLVAPNEKKFVSASIETLPLVQNTLKFSIEANYAGLNVVSSSVWMLQPVEEGMTQTLLPVQSSSNAVRAFVPSATKDSRFVFVFLIKTDNELPIEELAEKIILRVLE
jgi:hypothetical protein